LISQILSGRKDFTEEQIFSVCDFLGVAKLESEYLWILAQIERAGSYRLKQHYIDLREKIRKESLSISNRINKKNKILSQKEQSIFYSSWIYSAIQTATTLKNQVVDFKFICDRFSLQPQKARATIDFLIEARMIIEENGVFKQGTTSTHLERSGYKICARRK
jgi:uncharacterized protein (TIGR02147 family)